MGLTWRLDHNSSLLITLFSSNSGVASSGKASFVDSLSGHTLPGRGHGRAESLPLSTLFTSGDFLSFPYVFLFAFIVLSRSLMPS
jgi:hypothetical protein